MHRDLPYACAEFMMVTCMAGMFQSLVGPQPLIVQRPTGPVVLMLWELFRLSKQLWPRGDDDDDPEVVVERFLKLYAAVALFVGFYMAWPSASIPPPPNTKHTRARLHARATARTRNSTPSLARTTAR